MEIGKIEFHFQAFGTKERCQVLPMYRLDTGERILKSDNSFLDEVLEGIADECIQKAHAEEFGKWLASIDESAEIQKAKDLAFGVELPIDPPSIIVPTTEPNEAEPVTEVIEQQE